MRQKSSHVFARFLLGIYALALLRLVVFKGSAAFLADHLRHFGQENLREGYRLASFIPGRTLYYYLSLQEDAQTGLQNIGGNIALFLPCGFLLPLAFESFRSVGRLVAAALIISLFCETMQLLLAIGTFDVDDLLLNVLGAWLGYLLLPRHLRKAAQVRKP